MSSHDAIMRAITGFRPDAEHSRHMRHNPPLNNRPWVIDAAGRQDMIGTEISCALCERAEPMSSTERPR